MHTTAGVPYGPACCSNARDKSKPSAVGYRAQLETSYQRNMPAAVGPVAPRGPAANGALGPMFGGPGGPPGPMGPMGFYPGAMGPQPPRGPAGIATPSICSVRVDFCIGRNHTNAAQRQGGDVISQWAINATIASDFGWIWMAYAMIDFVETSQRLSNYGTSSKGIAYI